MTDDQGADSEATPDKSPSTGSFAEKFKQQMSEWATAGCPTGVRGGGRCGKPPHDVKPYPIASDGGVKFEVVCSAGHQAWEYNATAEELKKEAEIAKTQGQTQDVPLGDGRDPMIARITIIYDLRTQAVAIEPFIPSPLVGLGMLDVARKSLYDQMSPQTKERKDGLMVPERVLIDPKTGKAIRN